MHALLEAGLVHAREGRLVQQCSAGLIRLQVDRDDAGKRSIAFDLPEPVVTALGDVQVDELRAIVGTDLAGETRPRLIDVGPRWIVSRNCPVARRCRRRVPPSSA